MKRRLALALLVAISARGVSAHGDDAPLAELAAVQGAWRGQLTYRDYTRPDRLVTLPTQLYVTLTGPDELALHYVFDDGPNKTVYSYERWTFDFGAKVLAWTSGSPRPTTRQHRITGSELRNGTRVVTLERDDDQGGIERHVLSLGPAALSLGKEEGTASAAFAFRNRFEFSRSQHCGPSQTLPGQEKGLPRAMG